MSLEKSNNLEKSYLFYSYTQKKQKEKMCNYNIIFYKLENGKEVEVTEVRSLENNNNNPKINWSDAIYLGIGTFSRIAF
jgi:hypothetical protein